MNARGETHVEWLYDVPNYIWEADFHGVHSGAAKALAAAQLRHGAHLWESLTPDFVAESNDEGFEELMEEFAPCVNTVA